jgi:chromosome segregation ATPase
VTADRDSQLQRAEGLLAEGGELRAHAAEAAQTAAAALEEVRHQLATATADRDLQLQRGEGLLAEAGELRARAAEATQATSELEQILAAVIADRNAQLQRGDALVAKTISQEEQLAAVTDRLAVAQRERQEALEKARRNEAERIQSVDLASEFEAARRELLNTCAGLQRKLAQISGPV